MNILQRGCFYIDIILVEKICAGVVAELIKLNYEVVNSGIKKD